jgi:hypothetical protein
MSLSDDMPELPELPEFPELSNKSEDQFKCSICGDWIHTAISFGFPEHFHHDICLSSLTAIGGMCKLCLVPVPTKPSKPAKPNRCIAKYGKMSRYPGLQCINQVYAPGAKCKYHHHFPEYEDPQYCWCDDNNCGCDQNYGIALKVIHKIEQLNQPNPKRLKEGTLVASKSPDQTDHQSTVHKTDQVDHQIPVHKKYRFSVKDHYCFFCPRKRCVNCTTSSLTHKLFETVKGICIDIPCCGCMNCLDALKTTSVDRFIKPSILLCVFGPRFIFKLSSDACDSVPRGDFTIVGAFRLVRRKSENCNLITAIVKLQRIGKRHPTYCDLQTLIRWNPDCNIHLLQCGL